VTAIDPNRAIDFILKESQHFAAAKAQRVYLEHFLKSKKALLMNESTEKAANAREQYAYAHPDYIGVQEGLRAAVEIEERLKWELVGAQLRVEVWRSQESTNRAQDRSMR
jgi:hypothetical protein